MTLFDKIIDSITIEKLAEYYVSNYLSGWNTWWHDEYEYEEKHPCSEWYKEIDGNIIYENIWSKEDAIKKEIEFLSQDVRSGT